MLFEKYLYITVECLIKYDYKCDYFYNSLNGA